MTYPELSEVRKTFRVDWYRCPTRPGLLRELSRRSDAQGWFLAGGTPRPVHHHRISGISLLVAGDLAGVSGRAILPRYGNCLRPGQQHARTGSWHRIQDQVAEQGIPLFVQPDRLVGSL